MLEDLGEPLGIRVPSGRVRLPPREGFDVLGVDHEDLLKAPLEDVEDRLPVDARATKMPDG